MPLKKQYPERFQRLLDAYPNWPKGRTRPALAYKAYQKADKELKFTDEDISQIIYTIERRKQKAVKWQEGNQYGPVGLQVFINQQLWNDDYETLADKVKSQQSRSTWNNAPAWKQYGYESKEAYDRACEAKAPRISDMLNGLKGDLRRVH